MSGFIECEKCGFDTFAVQEDGAIVCDICGEDSAIVPINTELRKMVLELCNKVLDYNYVEDEFDIELAKQIREKLEAGE